MSHWISHTCPITGHKTNTEVEIGRNQWYTVSYGGIKVSYGLCTCFNKPFDIQKHIVKGVIANGKWPDERIFHVSECKYKKDNELELLSFLADATFPETTSEKKDNFFLSLFRMQEYDGQVIAIRLADESIWMKNYFRTKEECIFYFAGLKEEELISYSSIDSNSQTRLRITHKGLNKAIQLQTEGENSTNCFIAMAFTDKMLPYREAIKRALSKTGFQTVIMDEEHLASDKTIPDGILAAIRKSKFCIADFSFHRAGVYFESGFALGLGKPVIYTCLKKEFDKSHFDIKQLQHIVYETSDQLENRLVDKIEAWIK